jgi:transcriptional antiterminator NusG
MSDFNWYVVHTYSGYENKVKATIEKTIENRGLQEQIIEVSVPMMDVVEVKNGANKTVQRKKFPGYVFVNMVMNEETWYVVRNTPGVTGFVGSSGKGTKPFPVPREQVEPVLKRMGMIDEQMYDRYSIGDLVKVIHGALEGTEGNIVSINRETGAVELETVFFGRTTKLEVEFSEIEKV